MPGRPGRSGGHNRIAPDVHVLRGTFRPERHTLPSPAKSAEWVPTEPQLAGLHAAGRAFVARVLAEYQFTPMEGELVLETAQVCDRLAQLRRALAGADVALRLKLDRVEQGWCRQFATFTNALKVHR